MNEYMFTTIYIHISFIKRRLTIGTIEFSKVKKSEKLMTMIKIYIK